MYIAYFYILCYNTANMALERYSGPDLGFEEEVRRQPPVQGEVGEGRIPSFEEDVAEFLQARLHILQEDIAGDHPTDDTVQIDCLPRDPFGSKYRQWQSIRDSGYGVSFHESIVDGQPIPYLVDIYVSDEDEEAANHLFDRCEKPPKHRLDPPFHTLMYGEGSNIHAHYLDSDSEYGHDVRYGLSENYRPHEVDLLLTRQFLTSRVLDKISETVSSNSILRRGQHTDDLPMYRYLRDKGFAPFSPAELYDMAMSTTQHTLTHNPEIRPPAAVRQQQLPAY
jgi:hypothetical protein